MESVINSFPACTGWVTVVDLSICLSVFCALLHFQTPGVKVRYECETTTEAINKTYVGDCAQTLCFKVMASLTYHHIV